MAASSENAADSWNMAELSVSNPTDAEKIGVDNATAGEEDDRDLIARYLAGSEEAFNRLVLRHQRMAINLAYRLLANYEDACDIAQEAFVRVHKHLRRFKGNCSFKTWFYKIVLNLSRNRYRWKRRRREFAKVSLDNPGTGEEGERLDVPDESLSVAREIRRKEVRSRIEESLAQLPRDHREVLVLRYMEGLSYSDISGLLGCAEGTVKSRLHRARTEVRKLLADIVES